MNCMFMKSKTFLKSEMKKKQKKKKKKTEFHFENLF